MSRYAGQYEHVFETTTAGVTIQAPQVQYTYHPEFVLMSNRARLHCIILLSFSPCCFISISLLLLFCALYLVLYTLLPISSTKHFTF